MQQTRVHPSSLAFFHKIWERWMILCETLAEWKLNQTKLDTQRPFLDSPIFLMSAQTTVNKPLQSKVNQVHNTLAHFSTHLLSRSQWLLFGFWWNISESCTNWTLHNSYMLLFSRDHIVMEAKKYGWFWGWGLSLNSNVNSLGKKCPW